MCPSLRPRRLARPRTPPFHGDNTGSNPVGDAKINYLQNLGRKAWNLKTFDTNSEFQKFRC